MALLPFKKSALLTLGVELELQILDPIDYSLMPSAADLLHWVGRQRVTPGAVVPEVTQGMIEISTGIHEGHASLLAELQRMRDFIGSGARALNLRLAGGGTHPFQHWAENRISVGERYQRVSELYGYLVQQFTVFGQHIHVGCPRADDALWLLHALSRYMPHLIALSASSPFVQGRDTRFASARLNAISAFPLSGRAPFVLDWPSFEAYFAKMMRTGVVKSMKDFYWDIRPKPEFGTIEIRVCDTPLTVRHAADLAAYLQAICYYLLTEKPFQPAEDDYLVYSFNRFQASRFGVDGLLVDPRTGEHLVLRDDILATLACIDTHAGELGADAALARLRQRIVSGENDAQWCRARYDELSSLPEMMRLQAERWLCD